ncbi:MAG: AAA family ATPase [Candidatus Bathyarchaeota archaeon]|nr:MAG: AAA family ATPase [Candidatus Bathyarchaeota archaeon]
MTLSVFKNKETLSPDFPIEKYWEKIPHRADQIRILWNLYGDVLDRAGTSFLRRLQIIGPAGSGKTCTLKFFGQTFEEEAKRRGIQLDHVYMNLKFEGGRRVIFFRNLVNKIEPRLVSASFSAEELLRSLINYLQEAQRFILLTVDEIDYFVRRFKKEGIVYDLTRLNELSNQPCGIMGITFLARQKEFHDLLDPAELSTLGRLFIEFQPYSEDQILDILERRAEEAFNPGAYTEKTLRFIANITASRRINGDLRYALDLLLYAGILADNLGSPRVLLDHVRRVNNQISPSLTTEDLLGLSDGSKVVLLALIRSLSGDRPYASLIEIRENVDVLCENYSLRPIKHVEEFLQDLWDRQIIDLKSLMEIGISGAPVADLDTFLDNIIERLRAEVSHAAPK